MSYNTIDEIKQANTRLGHSWFDTGTALYHGSSVESEIIGGFYFVESSYRELGNSDSGKVFRAVAASPDGSVQYLSGADTFDTAESAREYIDDIVATR
ncbi:hypothetical protein [Rhodococcus sp. BS-15]|uniref:hypothetical protein n=1 Tax=Rhodococcus sp. BS-15 TaxID=1304954 RepID=UPI000B31E6C9|nr:hypothetical protein [Rhodococcus sp. BS-15]